MERSVESDFLYPEEIDRYLNWPLGTTTRLARKGKLPHYILPDGAIRLKLDEVKALVSRIRTSPSGEESDA